MWTNPTPNQLFYETALGVYVDDPLWPGESQEAIDWQFGSQNPYSKVVQTRCWGIGNNARLAGFYNPHLRWEGKKFAYFGFFESDRHTDTTVLFDAVEAWACECGAEVLYGPVNFTTYGNYRIRLGEGRGEPPFPGEPYNPGYYEDILKAQGYGVSRKWFSEFSDKSFLETMSKLSGGVYSSLEANAISVVPLNGDLWIERQREIYPIFKAIWQDSFGYVEIDFDTFASFFGREATNKLDPNVSMALLDEKDTLCGYFALYPDYGPLLSAGRESRVAVDAVGYQSHFAQLEKPRLLLKTACVHPAWRKKGLLTAMSVLACQRGLENGYWSPAACMMRDDNHSRRMSGHVSRINPKVPIESTDYALFSKSL